ncbi:MAG: hypothetical protein KJ995_05460 [Candidatus Omnitrophica bacterium]|nr:hypothetical protein [Candidatus Omnitrophota bacterium]MBU1851833.1 hypothetical protein [Candidatus Omnitrophota bacterium]
MISKPKPIPLAMIICDTVIEDKKTGKKSLIGIFDNINSPVAPCVHSRLNIFVSLTEGIGQYVGKMRCVQSDTNAVIFENTGEMIFKDRHQRIEFNFELYSLRFPEFGKYRFDFFCDDQPIIGRKFNVIKRQQDPNQPPEET